MRVGVYWGDGLLNISEYIEVRIVLLLFHATVVVYATEQAYSRSRSRTTNPRIEYLQHSYSL